MTLLHGHMTVLCYSGASAHLLNAIGSKLVAEGKISVF